MGNTIKIFLSIISCLVIFFIVYYIRDINYEQSQEIIRLQRTYDNLKEELDFLQNFEGNMQRLNNEIADKQEMYLRSASISVDKNNWSFVIYTLSEFVSRNQLIWIEQITTQGSRFTIRGKSYHRDRITNLSRVFEDGHISRIDEINIDGNTFWDFEISFLRPKAQETTAMVFPPHLQNFDRYYHNYQLTQRGN